MKRTALIGLSLVSFVFVGCSTTAESETVDTVLPTQVEDTEELIAVPAEVVETAVEETEELIEDEPTEPEINELSLEGVSQHNTPDDCRFIIDGKVYDVTGYDTSHPGGEAILKGCGLDATELFNTKDLGANAHGHGAAAKAQLESFYIGDLEE